MEDSGQDHGVVVDGLAADHGAIVDLAVLVALDLVVADDLGLADVPETIVPAKSDLLPAAVEAEVDPGPEVDAAPVPSWTETLDLMEDSFLVTTVKTTI